MAFSIVPLRAAAILGVIAILLSFLFATYSLFAKLFLHQSPRGFTALILVITFLSGIDLFFRGIIGEYVERVYEETKARPHYVIRKFVGQPARKAQTTIPNTVADFNAYRQSATGTE